MSNERILVIEDEDDIAEVMRYNLEREGFRVRTAGSGALGLERILREGADLVLLDLMLPDLDGIEVCRRLRQNPETVAVPVIMVTAKGEEEDVILGLGIGADDYIPKPFSPKELVARVKAVLRRGRMRDEEVDRGRVVRGPLTVDLLRHEVLAGGQPVSLTATEFRLLHYLASHPGRVFRRDELLRRVMGDSIGLVDRNIDVHVRSIRKKLGEYRTLIETVRGVGYRLRDL